MSSDPESKRRLVLPFSGGKLPFGDDEKRMTFTEHLGELRTRLIRVFIVVGIAVIGCFAISDPIFKLVVRPLSSPKGAPPIQVLGFFEMIYIKMSLAAYCGVLLSSPVIIWEICAFIFPGLRPQERRILQVLIFGCSVLATLGVLLTYFGIMPFLLTFAMTYLPEGVVLQPRASETVDLIVKIHVAFALAFQFPMAVLVLVFMGLLSPETLRAYRKIAIVGSAVFAAMVVPDWISMLIMMAPLLVLYEISIGLGRLVVRRKLAKEGGQP